MDDFASQFNEVLIEAYHNVLTLEEATRKYGRMNISLRDRNLLGFLYKNLKTGKSISEIADYLKVTRPSATAIVKKLEAAGCITRTHSTDDERRIDVTLTRKGRLLNIYHHMFRTEMANDVGKEFTQEEREVLYKGLCKLNDFFTERIRIMNEAVSGQTKK